MLGRRLDRCKLAARTVRPCKRQATAYVTSLAANGAAHADLADGEGAATAWKRSPFRGRACAATVHQALAAVTLMYEQADHWISVKRVRIRRPGEPDALTRSQEDARRRSAARRGPRDSAIIAAMLNVRAGDGEHIAWHEMHYGDAVAFRAALLRDLAARRRHHLRRAVA